MIGWLILALILSVSTFGINACTTISLVVIIFILGGYTCAYNTYESQTLIFLEKWQHATYDPPHSIIDMELSNLGIKNDNFDTRVTGSHVIDEELHLLIHLFFRDYIYPWYYTFSSNEDFPIQLREIIHKIVVSLSNRMKGVNWIPFLTTQLVDDVASHIRLYKQARFNTKLSKAKDLETHFFDLEFNMENYAICRDRICFNKKEEKYYVMNLALGLLLQFLPESDFACGEVRFLCREVFCNLILIPLFDKLTDPDYVNQTIIWLCEQFPISNQSFFAVLKSSTNLDELNMTRIFIRSEIESLRSRDGSGNDSAVKNQLSNLIRADKLIDTQLRKLNEIRSDLVELTSSVDYKTIPNEGLIDMSLEFILQNSVALSYFIDFMSSINAQMYIYAYLNIHGWKMMSSRDISRFNLRRQNTKHDKNNNEEGRKLYQRLRDSALLLFDQYLSEKASPNLNLKRRSVKNLYSTIQTKIPSEDWFDEVLSSLYDVIQNDDRYLKAFRKDKSYVKLIAELELLSEPSEENVKEEISGFQDADNTNETSLLGLKNENRNNGTNSKTVQSSKKSSSTKVFIVNAEIIEAGLVQEAGKMFGIYAVAVTKLYCSGESESWHIYRRYSDFYDFYQVLKNKYSDLGTIPFPGKKTFNNMDRNVLEKRMYMLNNYLKILLRIGIVKSHPSLQETLLSFLEPGEYDRKHNSDSSAHNSDSTSLNPLKIVGNAVKTMPDVMEGVREGFNRVFNKQSRAQVEETTRVGSEIDIESDDNIPLRIMLLLMTEIFDLKTRNQWLRRRIISLLRQIMNAMFGDIVNRRILDYVAVITSPQRVASGLASVRNSLWPGGVKVGTKVERSHRIKMQTRIAAKCSLLSSMPDDWKKILGSETSRLGLLMVFSMLQNEVLNRRLLYVVLEDLIVTLYPKMEKYFRNFHSNSPRVILYKYKLSCKT